MHFALGTLVVETVLLAVVVFLYWRDWKAAAKKDAQEVKDAVRKIEKKAEDLSR